MNRINTIGTTIKKLRILKGINQDVFSEILGISERLLCQIESGEKSPRFDILVKMAEILEMNFDDFILWKDEQLFNKIPKKDQLRLELEYLQDKISLYESLIREKNELLNDKNKIINLLENFSKL